MGFIFNDSWGMLHKQSLAICNQLLTYYYIEGGISLSGVMEQ